MTSNEPGSSMPSSSPSAAPGSPTTASTSTSTAPRRPRRRSRARWAVPATAVAAVAAVTAGVGLAPQIAGAVTGSLPARTPAQVLAAVAGAKAQPLSGTVVESADFGLPALPGTGSSTSLTSLLSGSHTLRVWYGSDKKERIAVVGDLAETDVVHNGTDLWLWSSSANTVEHVLLPTRDAAAAKPSSAAFASTMTVTHTPAEIAAEILRTLGPTTTVTVDGTVRVAGRSTYELVLTPKDARSLVGRVTIAVDAATSTPLRVQVFARGITSPAFSTGFTSLTTGTPDASIFAFVPPPGAKVTTKDLRGAGDKAAKPGTHPMTRGGAAAKAGEPTVSGSGWLTVVEASGTGAAAAALGSSSSGSASSTGSGATGSTSEELQTILRSATPVSGSFGTGSLIRTRLLTVLMLADGRVFAGAVVPSVLEQAAAR